MKRRSAAAYSVHFRVRVMRAAMHADQAKPVRWCSRGAKRSAAGMGFSRSPGAGKQSAQRRQARRRQRWKPKGRDAIGGSMRST